MTQKRPAGCALARRRNMSQATALGAKMCQDILSYEKPLYAEIKMCYTGLTSCLGWK